MELTKREWGVVIGCLLESAQALREGSEASARMAMGPLPDCLKMADELDALRNKIADGVNK